MSIIPFDPTINPGIGRNLRTFIRLKLLIPALLMALFWAPDAAAQSAETVTGKPGRANFRSVINFKGTALLEQRRGQTNAPQRANPAPFPRGSADWSGPPREDGGGVQSVQPNQTPQSQAASQNSVESIAASTGVPS